MKAIILAGGSGERLRPYTENLPKGMLVVGDKTLIERQVELYRAIGINDITIATGYMAEKIDYPGVNYAHNPNFKSTNMVETLMAARTALTGEVLVSYADLVFDQRVLEYMTGDQSNIGVLVDGTWRDYWTIRYGSVNTDIESLKVDNSGRITDIGKPENSPDNISGRYVGLLRFSDIGMNSFLSLYDRAKAQFWGQAWQASRLFEKAYMTDMLQALIDEGTEVRSVPTDGGWLEFDTVEDYEKFGDPKNGSVIEQAKKEHDEVFIDAFIMRYLFLNS